MHKGELRQVAPLLYMGLDTWPVRRHTYGHLPRVRASLPFDRY